MRKVKKYKRKTKGLTSVQTTSYEMYVILSVKFHMSNYPKLFT